MTYDLLLGGVPYGFDYLGEPDGQQYVQSFYDTSCKDRLKFLVQIKENANKKHCYYNYLLYEGVVASNDREGSFFGLTLRFDEFCKNIIAVYSLLDLLYSLYVHGHGKLLAENTNGKLRYTVSNFNGLNGLRKQMEDAAGQFLRTMVQNGSFVPLDGYPPMQGSYYQVHRYDYNNTGLEALVKRYGGVAISPYYDGKRIATLTQDYKAELKNQEKDYEQKLHNKDHDYNNEKQALNSQLNEVRKENGDLNTKLKLKEQTISILRQQNEKLKEDNEKLRQVKEISTLVAEIKQPVTDLVKIENEAVSLRKGMKQPLAALTSAMSELSMRNKLDNQVKGPQRGIWRYFNINNVWFYLAIFLAIVLIGVGYKQCSSWRNSSLDYPHTATNEASFENVSDADTHEESTTADEPQKPEETGAEQSPAEQPTVKIDIVEYGGNGPLEKGKPYTVELKGAAADMKGRWNVDGASTGEDTHSLGISITPNDTIVKIAFVGPDEKMIVNRELKAK